MNVGFELLLTGNNSGLGVVQHFNHTTKTLYLDHRNFMIAV